MIHLTMCKYIFVTNRECNCSYSLLTYGMMAHSDMYNKYKQARYPDAAVYIACKHFQNVIFTFCS